MTIKPVLLPLLLFVTETQRYPLRSDSNADGLDLALVPDGSLLFWGDVVHSTGNNVLRGRSPRVLRAHSRNLLTSSSSRDSRIDDLGWPD